MPPGNGADSSVVSVDTQATTSMPAKPRPIGDLLGYYVGDFDAVGVHGDQSPSDRNRINLSLDRIQGDSVYGHSVVAGNLRPFAGTWSDVGGKYHVDAHEPGDNRYDGYFDFSLLPKDDAAAGVWIAYDTTIAVYRRKFDLKFATFEYDPTQDLDDLNTVFLTDEYGKQVEKGDKIEVSDGGANKFNASVVKLKGSDIENLYKGDLEIMRNAIYARHGYSFKNRRMRYVFDNGLAWYIPVSVDVSKDLTPLEKENIALIKRYEDHAENYYDKFGR